MDINVYIWSVLVLFFLSHCYLFFRLQRLALLHTNWALHTHVHVLSCESIQNNIKCPSASDSQAFSWPVLNAHLQIPDSQTETALCWTRQHLSQQTLHDPNFIQGSSLVTWVVSIAMTSRPDSSLHSSQSSRPKTGRQVRSETKTMLVVSFDIPTFVYHEFHEHWCSEVSEGGYLPQMSWTMVQRQLGMTTHTLTSSAKMHKFLNRVVASNPPNTHSLYAALCYFYLFPSKKFDLF